MTGLITVDKFVFPSFLAQNNYFPIMLSHTLLLGDVPTHNGFWLLMQLHNIFMHPLDYSIFTKVKIIIISLYQLCLCLRSTIFSYLSYEILCSLLTIHKVLACAFYSSSPWLRSISASCEWTHKQNNQSINQLAQMP